MKKIIIASLVTTLAGASAAQAHGHRGHHGGKLFAHMDADGDGRITQAEWSTAKLEHFDKSDADGDGLVTPEEMKAAHQARRAKRFAKKDADGDGRLSPDEVPWMDADKFARKDKDGDGYLSTDELRHGKRHGRHGKAGKHKAFGKRILERIDTDQDGAISRDEAEAAANGFFAKLDADQDGTVTKEEAREGFRAMKKRFGKRSR